MTFIKAFFPGMACFPVSLGWCDFMYSGFLMDSYILGADLTNQNSCSAKAELDAVDKLGVNALKWAIQSRFKYVSWREIHTTITPWYPVPVVKFLINKKWDYCSSISFYILTIEIILSARFNSYSFMYAIREHLIHLTFSSTN